LKKVCFRVALSHEVVNPFQLVDCIHEVPLPYQSVASHGDWIYVGTKDGQVLVYAVERKISPQGKAVYSSRMEKKRALPFGKKPIEALEICAEIGRLIAFCGETAHAHATLEHASCSDVDCRWKC
jgi:hypothetical protein